MQSAFEQRDVHKEGVLRKKDFRAVLQGADLWVSERDVDVIAMFLDLERHKSISYVTFNHLLSRGQVIDSAHTSFVSHLAYLRGVVAFVEHLDESHQRALGEFYGREAIG